MTTSKNRAYYDAFSERYDKGRSAGYHKLIDDQAAAIVRRVGQGREVLEVGCGTGLVLERVAEFASAAQGIDLSPGMLERARERGLDVREASAIDLPYDNESFDVVYSFKVLAHIPEFDLCLREMIRVVRPGGHVIFDVYNRNSVRYWIKRLFGPRRTSASYDEAAIETRFWSPDEAASRVPERMRVVSTAGIRVATLHPAMLRVPMLRTATEMLEWRLMDSPLWRIAGFLVYTLEKLP